MARIGITNVGKYQGGNNGGYFTLSDDGDSATVRFLYNQPDGSDIDFFLVHEVEIEGKRRYVSCNAVDEDGNMHTDDCPLCKSGNKAKEKLFLQLVDENDLNTVKVWERGSKFVAKIVTYLNKFGDLSSIPIEIVRRGKKGDTSTQYEFLPGAPDGRNLKDFAQRQEIEGTIVIKASKQDMINMLNNNYSTGSNNTQQNEQPAYTNSYAPRTNRGSRTTSTDIF